ncbi:Histidine triad (HIT) protein [Nitrobacter sp. Nb-311A]|nr:Histidine triad (HIT) protein [Nitrobacter sp. Nb-311A]
MSEAWSLHPQLDNDTVGIGDLPLSRLLLSKDASYPWLILVPRRPGAIEIIDLDRDDRARLMTEIAHASAVRATPLGRARSGAQRPRSHMTRQNLEHSWVRSGAGQDVVRALRNSRPRNPRVLGACLDLPPRQEFPYEKATHPVCRPSRP